MKETQRIAILTNLFVGYRIGELLALEISDFNFTMAHSSWPNPHNLLFPSTKGTYIAPKSEIKVEGKVPLNIVQGILGNSSIETAWKYLHKNEDIEREAIGTMSDYLNVEKLVTAPALNGAKKRGKFAGITLPDFSRQSEDSQ